MPEERGPARAPPAGTARFVSGPTLRHVVVMTGAGAFVEVQGTAEQTPFSKARLDELLALAGDGIARLVGLQRRALEARGDKTFTL